MALSTFLKKMIRIIFQNGHQNGRQFPKNQIYTGNCSSLTILCGDIETGNLSDIKKKNPR